MMTPGTRPEPFDASESRALRAVAGFMIPSDPTAGLPGADDPTILADILASLGRDGMQVRRALEQLGELAGAEFDAIDDTRRARAVDRLRAEHGALEAVLIAVVTRCYYRDDRVMRAIGMPVRPPYPDGFEVPAGDFGLLEPVKARGPIHRAPPADRAVTATPGDRAD